MQTKTATRWEEIVRNPHLRDLPFKVETNEHGQIVLSPHTNRHSILQGEIGRLLDRHITGGRSSPEYPVQTSEGTKVPDVVWMSEERSLQVPPDAADSPVMPELCVEVLSFGNSTSEIDEKRRLYFEGRAEEVWTVGEDGVVVFYSPDGRMRTSKLARDFPSQVEC